MSEDVGEQRGGRLGCHAVSRRFQRFSASRDVDQPSEVVQRFAGV